MRNNNRTRTKKQSSRGTTILLRIERGDLSAVAEELGVDPSLVSRVARGEKRSERVRLALVRRLLSRDEAPESATLIEHSGSRR